MDVYSMLYTKSFDKKSLKDMSKLIIWNDIIKNEEHRLFLDAFIILVFENQKSLIWNGMMNAIDSVEFEMDPSSGTKP